ncbi:hypothetical protein ACF08O_25075 [Streptomyces paradoxus]|uniref:hypothetical protein n=1 Tax=Streptomyces paradoxus TaxID=66375 RepID=UPI00370134A0
MRFPSEGISSRDHVTTYTYDDASELTGKNGSTTNWSYDSSARRPRARAPPPAATLNSLTTGGKSHYYLTDATGNVFGLADDTGKRTHTYAYGPPGQPRGTTTSARTCWNWARTP